VGLSAKEKLTPCPLSASQRGGGATKVNYVYLYTNHNEMGGRGYLDYKVIKAHARELRKSMTDSEILLWEKLRNRNFLGYKFLRQHPIVYKADFQGLNYFVADFYCDEKKAVIELDGPIHETTIEYDQFRDEELKRLGLRILRLKNDELENMDDTLLKIKLFLELVP